MRKLIFWSHLTVGLMVALVVLMLSLTGLLLTYEAQITRWAQTPAVSEVGTERLSADELAGIAPIETGGGRQRFVLQKIRMPPWPCRSGEIPHCFSIHSPAIYCRNRVRESLHSFPRLNICTAGFRSLAMGAIWAGR